MSEKEEKLPRINTSQTIGRRAWRVFEYHCPSEWIINPSIDDYGWDGIVTVSQDKKIKEAFFVQMKGSNSPSYIEDKNIISLPLEVSTIRSLLSIPIPSMLSICDTGKDESEPVYWVWLNEAIKEIEKNTPNWENQETVSIHIPTSQEFTKKSAKEIEKYLSEFYAQITISKEIIDVIKLSIGLQDVELAGKSIDEAVQIAKPHLIDAGLIDIEKEEGTDILKALSPDDQKRYREIKEVSILLKNYQDEKALLKLNDISKKIEFSSKTIKARYFNNRGVLATRLYNNDEALNYYKKACELDPGHIKYETNLLNTEYEIVIKKGFNEFTIVDDWKQRLEIIINKNPGYYLAIRLKTVWLGNMCGFENAVNFINKSQVWNDEPIASRLCLMELCIDLGEFDKAIDIYNDAKSLNVQLELPFWSISGYVLFMRALGKTSFHDECQVFGAGPSNINLDLLKKAEECFENAFNELLSAGLPKFSEQTIINYSSILALLNKNERSEYINKAYLSKYPENYLINGSLSTVISKQGDHSKAIPYAKKAFENDPKPSLSYRNYCLCLYLADEHDQLIELINSRIASGFDDKEEEGLSRTLLSISFNEIGKIEKANEQIDYLKNSPEHYVFRIISEGEIANKNGESREIVLNIYKKGLEATSNDEKLIAYYVQYLNPNDKKQAEDLVHFCEIVSKKRELMPYEYLSYGRAYLTLNKPEDAMQVYLRAHNHYPEMSQICCELALSIADIGDIETAYKILEQYFQASTFNYNLLVNMASLAMDTDRLDKAINLFQIALKKTKDQKIKGDIHCQLYELKKRKKQPLKELLRHIHEFGQTIKDDLQREARYIMMMMLSSHITPDEQDEEINEWLKIASKRLEEFSEKHPNFPMLRTFKINTNIPEEQRGWDILTTLASVMLPFHLISSSLRIAVRGQAWPLEFRANHLGRCSLFEYWSRCVKSKEDEHSIHICNFLIPLAEEHKNAAEANKTGRICVDITALLTLAEFEMLNILLVFDEIIISRGTKQLLDMEFIGILEPHGLAKKIEEWRLENRNKIRIRNFYASKEYNLSEDRQYMISKEGILLRRDQPINELFGKGIGETVLLAKTLGLPLYSDETTLRYWARTDYNLKVFSTISLFTILRAESVFPLDKETEIFAKMINKNFKIVPFDVIHLNNRLRNLILLIQNTENRAIKKEDLSSDEIMGTFIRQFGETSLNLLILYNIAVSWWVNLLKDESIPESVKEDCISIVSFFLSMHSVSGIIKGVIKDEPDDRYASIWVKFLLESYFTELDLVPKAWSSIKTCCENIPQMDEARYKKILYQKIPKWLTKFIELNSALNKNKKIENTVSITLTLPEEDRNQIDEYIQKNKPNYM